MEVIEPQFKVMDIPEAISLSFKGFYFVIDSLDLSTRDFMLYVI